MPLCVVEFELPSKYAISFNEQRRRIRTLRALLRFEKRDSIRLKASWFIICNFRNDKDYGNVFMFICLVIVLMKKRVG